MEKHFKIIVEKHPDGFVAYPLGLKGSVVGEGDTSEEALADVKSAIRFHVETFGRDSNSTDNAQSSHHQRFNPANDTHTVRHIER